MLKNSLRQFSSVAQHGSLRAAAGVQNIAQSALSRQIQQLEAKLGADLFIRGSRGVELTREGKLLQALAQNVDSDLNQLRLELDSLRELRSGHVRVASIQSVVPTILSSALKAFREDHPAVTFEIEVGGTDDIVSALRQRHADVGVSFCCSLTDDLNVAFRSREPIFAVMSTKQALARRKAVTVKDIASLRLALPPWSSSVRTIIETAALSHGTVLKPVLETNSLTLLHSFAQTGGIAIMTGHHVLTSVKANLVVARRFKEGLGGTLEVLTLRDRSLSPAASGFVEALRRAAKAWGLPRIG